MKKTVTVSALLLAISAFSNAKTLTIESMINLTETQSDVQVQQGLAKRTTYISNYATYNPLSVTASMNYAPGIDSSSSDSSTNYNGQVQLSFPGDWSITSNYSPGVLNPNQGGSTWSIGIGNSIQNLIYSSYSHGIKQADLQLKQTDIQNTMAINGEINANITAYFQIISNKASLETAKIAYSQAQSMLEQMKIKIKQGMITSLDLKQQEIKTAQAQLALVTQEENNEIAIKDFCFKLNIPYDKDLDLTVPPLPSYNLEKQLLKYGALTKENLTIADTLNDDNTRFNDIHTTTIPDITVSMNYGEATPNTAPTWYVSFSTQYQFLPPQFKGETDRIQAQTNAITKKNANNSLDVGIVQMKQSYRNNKKNFSLSKMSKEIAMKQYEVAKTKYLAGQLSYQDYLTAQSGWISAEQAYVSAFQNYYTSVYLLLYPEA